MYQKWYLGMDVKLQEEISGYSYGLEGLSSYRIDEKWNID